MSLFASVFSELFHLFPRGEFQRAVEHDAAERHAQVFNCCGHFVAMLFCQLGRATSLPEIRGTLARTEGKLSHLGIIAPSRLTLPYANEHRPWGLYQAVFLKLLTRCQAVTQGHRRFQSKNRLFNLHASVIDLCASVFDWATGSGCRTMRTPRTRGRCSESSPGGTEASWGPSLHAVGPP